MASKAIKTEKGLKHQAWIRLADDELSLFIYGKIFIKDQAFDDDLNEIIQKQNELESIVNLQLVRHSGPQHFYASHTIPFDNGIPSHFRVWNIQTWSLHQTSGHH
jgi:hypothetical protein